MLLSTSNPTRRWAALLLAAATLGLATPLLAQTYAITDLGPQFVPQHINDNGVIVGIDDSVDPPQAVLYRDGALVTIDTMSRPEAISDTNLIAGVAIESATDHRARLWQETRRLGDLDSFSNLIDARGINDFGESAGTRLVDGFRRPFVYDFTTGRLATLTTLGGAEGWANDINNGGETTGSAFNDDGEALAYRYDELDGFTDLGTLDGYNGSEGARINDAGTVSGWTFNDSADSRGKRGFTSSRTRGLINLGVLEHDTDSIARDLNNAELVIGQSQRADGTGRAFQFDIADADQFVVVAHPTEPDTVFATSTNNQGILRSHDRGLNWEPINRGLTELTVWELTFDPNDPDTLFAGSNSGIFISNNGGDEWAFTSPSLENVPVFSILVNSRSPDVVYAGTVNGLFISNNGGTSWSPLSTDQQDIIQVNVIKEHPTTPSLAFAGTINGVYRIDNQALNDQSEAQDISWSLQQGQDDSSMPNGTNVLSLAITSQNPVQIFAGTARSSVFRSSLNDALSWTSVANDGLPATVFSLIFDNDDTLYAGTLVALFRSADRGESWNAVSAFGNRGVFTLSLFAGVQSTLYASTFDGSVLRTDDRDPEIELASQWTSITNGVAPPDAYTLAILSDDPDNDADQTEFFLGASSGVFRRGVNDPSWEAAVSGVTNLKTTALTVDSTVSPARVWAGTSDQGVFVSEDGGERWLSGSTGLVSRNIHALAVDTNSSPPLVFAGTLSGAFRSEDGGVSWEAGNEGLDDTAVLSLLFDTSTQPAVLYAGTASGVFRSSDLGLSWVPLNQGIEDVTVTSLVRDDTNDLIFAAGTDGGVFQFDPNAVSWLDITGDLPDPTVFTLAVDPAAAPTVLYAGTTTGVYRFESGNWSARNSGLETTTVYTLAMSDERVILAGTDSDAVHLSEDDGVSWRKIEEGLADTLINIVALDELVENPDWQLVDATAVNNVGQIVGWGYFQGQPHGYLLTPLAGLNTADLRISQSTTPDTLKPDVPMVFQIQVRNQGPSDATDVWLTNWLPQNVIFRSASTSRGTCEAYPDSERVRCDIGNIEVGETIFVNLSLQPTEGQQELLNIADVNGNEVDPTLNNNTTGTGITAETDRCFIATATYGSFLDPRINHLRAFRDDYLLTHAAGRYLVHQYYQHSPPLAQFIREHQWAKVTAMALLTPIVLAVQHPVAAMLLLIAGIIMVRRRRKRRLRQPIAQTV